MFHFEVIDEEVSVDTSRPRTTHGTASGEPWDATTFNCGDRIFDADKYSGVVKYVGSVGKFSGTWVGVEWDVASRGKHSGKVDDTEYFVCTVPNSGSFVRPHKAKKVHNIKEALELRYGDQDEASLTSIKSIEDRLERKKISYSQLRTLNLNSRGIEDSSMEDIEELVALCPNVEALELADNFLTSWSFIASLAAKFSKLSRLDLSKNPLTDIKDEELETFKDSFPKTEHVILGSIGYEWNCLLKLSALWPKISNLQIPFNKVSLITPPITTMMNITRMDLERNKLSCWQEVLKLSILPKLEYLNLCGNGLRDIRFPPEIDQVHSENTSFFPNLRNLNITENSIEDWISVSELNKLKSLLELRIDLNPLLNKDSRATNRQMIIARVGKIQKLEGVDVHRQERRDSEIDYVKRFASQWELEKDSFRFAAENPRYRELVEKWGASETREETSVKTMKSSLISISLVPQPPSNHPKCTKKILATMTVQKLKGLIQRMFHEKDPPSKITAVSSRNPDIIFPLEDDFTDLATYSIEEGDTLQIAWD